MYVHYKVIQTFRKAHKVETPQPVFLSGDGHCHPPYILPLSCTQRAVHTHGRVCERGTQTFPKEAPLTLCTPLISLRLVLRSLPVAQAVPALLFSGSLGVMCPALLGHVGRCRFLIPEHTPSSWLLPLGLPVLWTASRHRDQSLSLCRGVPACL